ncbi:MAG: crossover junction endodeoxyribonuclease RuvC [Anaerolineales bacterium]|nr:crossover junction endodeoxyribonuclease RuvC [Anaerolineales bacterium]
MIVIGIDPGTALTGYGIIEETENGQLAAIKYGIIETSAEQTLEKRLQIIYQALSELLNLHRPETGAVEKLFFQKNVRTAMSVGQARGVAMLALAEADVKVAEYSPMEIKQAVTGYGAADKTQVQQMVRTILSLEAVPRPDDVADALAVAICHINSNQWEKMIQANKG